MVRHHMNAFADRSAGLNAKTHVAYLPLECQHQEKKKLLISKCASLSLTCVF